jgi:hypothetical protein
MSGEKKCQAAGGEYRDKIHFVIVAKIVSNIIIITKSCIFSAASSAIHSHRQRFWGVREFAKSVGARAGVGGLDEDNDHAS